jgi:DNA-binding LytR/AlgR family response regulator
MATWKRLTGADGKVIDVNMDQVCYVRQHPKHTSIHFVGGRQQNVKDKADDMTRLNVKFGRTDD